MLFVARWDGLDRRFPMTDTGAKISSWFAVLDLYRLIYFRNHLKRPVNTLPYHQEERLTTCYALRQTPEK